MHPKLSEFLSKLSLVNEPLKSELKVLAFEVMANSVVEAERQIEVLSDCESCSA